MPLKLMYITNQPDIVRIAESAGVDWIFADMEFIGKQARQGGLDTVQYHHTVEDVRALRKTLTKSKLLVRVNPIHEAGSENGCSYGDSAEEINAVIEAGADILMLPYFKTAEEVRTFVRLVNGRAVTFPLLETPEAVDSLDEILQIPGIDQIHIGLNDLSLGLHSGFMFGLLCDGTVDHIAQKCKEYKMPFGIGGIAGLGQGMLPSDYILGEHYRLGSEFTILSRSFCNSTKIKDLNEIERIFRKGVPEIRALEEKLEERCKLEDKVFFRNNHLQVERCVKLIQGIMQKTA